MLFNSYIFILLFLPVTIAGWFFLYIHVPPAKALQADISY